LTTPIPVAEGIYPLAEPLDGRRLALVLIVGERGAVLVDTGVAQTPERLVFPALAELGLTPADIRFIVITHSDVDHSGGLGAMLAAAPEATAIAHRLDVRWIEDVELLIDERYRGFRHAHEIDQDEQSMQWTRNSDSRGVVHLGVAGGETLRLDGLRELELVHVPGHSRGHLAVIDAATGTALIGDAVFGGVTPALDGSGLFAPGYYDPAAYRRTVARLQELAPRRLVGAHYPILEGEQAEVFLAESAAFCARLEAAVLEALESSPRRQTTRAVIGAVAPAIRAWPPEADLSLSAAVVGHLEDLRQRGLAELVPGSPVAWRGSGER
jgi:glyoxylase-like metal-dependent hydrolase (beta-lactamase superfamily II)